MVLFEMTFRVPTKGGIDTHRSVSVSLHHGGKFTLLAATDLKSLSFA